MLSDKRCGYFIKSKNRYCRQIPVQGSDHCFNHAGELSTNRVVCPLDSKHFVSRSNLEKHLTKCNESRKVGAIYNVPGINSTHLDLDIPSSKVTLANVPAVTVLSLIARLEELNAELNLIDHINDLSTGDIHPLIAFTLNNHRHWCSNGFPGLKEIPLLQSDITSVKKEDNEVNKANFQINPERVIHGSNRHIYQNGRLIRVLENKGLLSTNNLYLEFGAGRAGLSHWINNCLASTELGACCYDRYPGVWPVKAPETNFLLVELNSVRDKMDKRQGDEGNFTRLRINIADLDLSLVPLIQQNKRPVIAVAKHLCGDATDLSLRCLKNGEHKFELSGIMFAVCCHHKCTWHETAGRVWLEKIAKITPDQFSLITLLASWAVCGMERRTQHTENFIHSTTDQDYKEALKRGKEDECQTALHSLDVNIKMKIGKICKRLIDWGRLMYIKHELKLFDAQFISYATSEVTPENIVICATKLTKSLCT
ncbi:unnamed protein product [Heterobilharzia americana]|nr:unnamed protein product [Heterobilharzia americana]CAH8573482.1 unnamed protein product [Heterobilharzia americana]